MDGSLSRSRRRYPLIEPLITGHHHARGDWRRFGGFSRAQRTGARCGGGGTQTGQQQPLPADSRTACRALTAPRLHGPPSTAATWSLRNVTTTRPGERERKNWGFEPCWKARLTSTSPFSCTHETPAAIFLIDRQLGGGALEVECPWGPAGSDW